MFAEKNAGKVRIVISGSFKKYLPGIQEKIKEFQNIGVEVLSPRLSDAVDPNVEFIILKSDTSEDPIILERNHLRAIKKAQGLYIFNVNGYIGPSSTLELGYAFALGKKIFSKEIPTDVSLRLFCKVATAQEVKDEIISQNRKLFI